MKTRLILTIAAPALEDRAPLEETRRWYRNGTRGLLHADANCHKLEPGRITSLDATMLDAAARADFCGRCGTRRLPSELATTMATYAYMRELTDRLAVRAQQCGDPAELGALLRELDGDAACWVGVDDSMLTAAAQQELDAEHAELRRSIQAKLAARTSALCVSVAVDLLVRTEPLGITTAALDATGISDANHLCALFGDRPVPGARPGSTQLEAVFAAWCSARANGGPAAALDAAHAAATTSSLTRVAQLDAVTLTDIDHRGNLREAADAAWRRTIEETTDALCGAWEAEITAMLAGSTRPTLAGTARHDLRSPGRYDAGVHGRIAAIRAAGAARTRGEVAVYRSNDLFDRYVADGLSPNVVRESVADDGTITDAVFETAAALWDPGSDGPYRSLPGSVAAARALT